MLLIFAGILVLLFFVIMHSYAGEATLSWDAPTTNEDGTPLEDLAGYKVYRGTAPRTYGTPVDVGNVLSHNIIGLGEGTHYFAVTAYDTSGNESKYSNEVSKTIKVTPGCPGNLRVQ